MCGFNIEACGKKEKKKNFSKNASDLPSFSSSLQELLVL